MTAWNEFVSSDPSSRVYSIDKICWAYSSPSAVGTRCFIRCCTLAQITLTRCGDISSRAISQKSIKYISNTTSIIICILCEISYETRASPFASSKIRNYLLSLTKLKTKFVSEITFETKQLRLFENQNPQYAHFNKNK